MPNVYVPPRGNRKAKLMFVGEAPGAQEERTGQPFVGPAGGVLTECTLKAGIDPESCFYTNVLKYRPPDNDFSAWVPKGVPNELVLEGMAELAQEIEEVNPNVIVPLGNWALWALYNNRLSKEGYATGIKNFRGYVLEARRLAKGKKLIPTLHPSYLLRGAFSEIPLAIFDLKRAAKESAYPDVRRKPRRTYVDPRGNDRDTLRSRLLTEGRWLVVDIEYVGTRLLCVGFSVSPDWAVTIKIRSPADLDFCRQLIESGRPLCMQNGMFDCSILEWHYKMEAFKHLKFDTMVAAYNINIEYPKDLGFLGGMYTDLPPWWENIDDTYWAELKKGLRDPDEVLEYNCIDCMATYEIAEKSDPELDIDPAYRRAFKFDMEKLPHLWDIAKRGVPVDSERLLSIKSQAIKDAEEAQVLLNELADTLGMDLPFDKEEGRCTLNVKSGPQIARFLFLELDIEPTKKTKGGNNWATDSKTLMEYYRTSNNKTARRAIELILTVREGRDFQSKFTDIEWDDDNRARTIYDPTKTETRRLSSKKFFPTGRGGNLQNVPAPGSNKYGKAARQCFIPDRGFEFAYADLKGAEFLVVAKLTQDPLMLKYAEMSMKGTGDVHRETAAFIFSRMTGKVIKPEDIGKDSPERYLGKKTRHSANYMIGWKTFMENINKEALETGVWLDAKMSKGILAAYKELHPGLPRWWDEVEIEVREKKKLANLFGHVRRFNGNIKAILPVAVAFTPQSTIGDYLNFGLLACAKDPQLKDAGFELLLQVHDAIGFQYPKSNRFEVLSRVRRLMDIGCTIPKTGETLHIPVEIQCGPSWGEEELWEEDLKRAA